MVVQWSFGSTGRDLVAIPLAILLVWSALIDHERLLLPDALTYPMIAGGIAWAFQSNAPAPVDSLIGAMAGYGVFALLARGFEKLRGRAGLGLGDAKLVAAAGAWMGWTALPLVALAASGAGLAVTLLTRLADSSGRREKVIAFGPYLSAGFWLVWVMAH
jgi:leader peptidase (prepilin peptidase)/N-methyltransferase